MNSNDTPKNSGDGSPYTGGTQIPLEIQTPPNFQSPSFNQIPGVNLLIGGIQFPIVRQFPLWFSVFVGSGRLPFTNNQYGPSLDSPETPLSDWPNRRSNGHWKRNWPELRRRCLPKCWVRYPVLTDPQLFQSEIRLSARKSMRWKKSEGRMNDLTVSVLEK